MHTTHNTQPTTEVRILEEVDINGKTYRRSVTYPTLLVAEDGTVVGPSGKELKPQKLNKYGHLAIGIYNPSKRANDMTYLHRVVATAWIPNPHCYEFIDHIAGDVTDNRACALRWADNRTNTANSARRRAGGTTSQYVGVTLFKKTGKWCATIRILGKHYHLLYCESETACARAYDAALIELGLQPINFPLAA